MGSSKAMDRVRRGVDAVMIFTSLLMLTWLSYFDSDHINPLAAGGVVLFLGLGVILLAMRWPLLQYAPVASAVIMAGHWDYRDGRGDGGATRLVIATSAI